MLIGILRRRDAVVSTEACSGACVTAPAAPMTTAAASHTFEFSDDHCSEISDYGVNFEGVISQVASRGKLDETAVEIAKIRRLVTFAMLKLCVSDLPVELPTLLAWALQQQARWSLSCRLASLRCVKYYLCSGVEEEVAYQLRHSLFAGVHGTPSYVMPHVRRSDQKSYALTLAESRENRLDILDKTSDIFEQKSDAQQSTFGTCSGT